MENFEKLNQIKNKIEKCTFDRKDSKCQIFCSSPKKVEHENVMSTEKKAYFCSTHREEHEPVILIYEYPDATKTQKSSGQVLSSFSASSQSAFVLLDLSKKMSNKDAEC